MAEVRFETVRKTFGKVTAVDNVELTVEDGEFVVLLGPSGCGKTTLLRTIAGLEEATEGEVLIGGNVVNGLPPRARQVAMVFQNYALYPHKSVLDNIVFPLKAEKLTREQRQERARWAADLLGIGELLERKPRQLSGGQRQRVALARALAVEPRVLLLDEPFGALDAKVRQELRRWLRRLHDELGITSVFVTHDREEALELADRVAVMNAGRIEQVGTPQEVYDRPVSPFAYAFLGDVNRFDGRLDGGRLRVGEAELSVPELGDSRERSAVGFARPHEIEVARGTAGRSAIPAVVRQVQVVGPLVRLELGRLDSGDAVEAELSREAYRDLASEVGESVALRPRNLRVFVEER